MQQLSRRANSLAHLGLIAVQQQPEAYLVGDPKWSMDSGAAARTRVVNHSRSSGDSTTRQGITRA